MKELKTSDLAQLLLMLPLRLCSIIHFSHTVVLDVSVVLSSTPYRTIISMLIRLIYSACEILNLGVLCCSKTINISHTLPHTVFPPNMPETCQMGRFSSSVQSPAHLEFYNLTAHLQSVSVLLLIHFTIQIKKKYIHFDPKCGFVFKGPGVKQKVM